MSELLAPAGTLAHLRHAFAYGADAVYAGMPRYGLRVRENHFSSIDNLTVAIEETHAQAKKIYITANIYAHNTKIKTFIDDIVPLIELQPDALIMADPGLIMLVRDKWPDMPVHLSVQANTLNYATVEFWRQAGIGRVILSRELSLAEIREIRARNPDIELETFVHGALCIAYSGRCLLSGFINHRDANQGTCTNACRWEYQPVSAEVADNGELVKAKKSQRMLIAEIGRPNEEMQIEEDEHGSYIMNSKDLRALEHINELTNIGIDSFKIEGRTKSIYYVSRVVQSYRQAIDDAQAGRAFNASLLGEVENLANRGYTSGFFQRHQSREYQNYFDGNSRSKKQLYVADITGFANGMLHIISKNKICCGDMLEIILPGGNEAYELQHIEDMQGRALTEIAGGGVAAKIPFHHGRVDFGLVAKELV